MIVHDSTYMRRKLFVKGGGAERERLIMNDTRNYNSLILVMRPKFVFSLKLYSDVVITMKLYCLLFAQNSRWSIHNWYIASKHKSMLHHYPNVGGGGGAETYCSPHFLYGVDNAPPPFPTPM